MSAPSLPDEAELDPPSAGGTRRADARRDDPRREDARGDVWLRGEARRTAPRPDARHAASQGPVARTSTPTATAGKDRAGEGDARFDALLPREPLGVRVRIAPGMCGVVLTGLAMLAREGRIRLDVELRPAEAPLETGPWHLRDKQRLQTVIEVEGASGVLDPHDSWEIDEADLAAHDLYFKRSLAAEVLLMEGGHKLRTLGLTNDVRPDFFDGIELRNELAAGRSAGERLKILLRWALLSAGARWFDFGGRPTLSRMSAPPTPGQPPGVLLMAGLWDPDQVPDWAVGKRAEWEAINRQRAGCIRALRRAFGDRFYGGVRPTPFTRRYSPDILLPSASAGRQRNFVREARRHPVCVTSMGLHGSNGWRLAEFVALSRAIVSEPLRYQVPGDFAPGSHYLPFTTPDQCVEQVSRLFDEPALRDQIAQRNWDYFQRWQRPDRMALRLIALTYAASRRKTPAPARTAFR